MNYFTIQGSGDILSCDTIVTTSTGSRVYRGTFETKKKPRGVGTRGGYDIALE